MRRLPVLVVILLPHNYYYHRNYYFIIIFIDHDIIKPLIRDTRSTKANTNPNVIINGDTITIAKSEYEV